MALPREGRAIQGRIAGLSQKPDENAEQIEQARLELRGYSAENAARKLVANWAPLSEEAVDRIVVILRGAAK
jgi:hypothetical protein